MTDYELRKRRMIREVSVQALLWTGYITAMILVTALAVHIATVTRGYMAFGGEWMIWLIPVFWGLARREKEEERRDI